MIAEEWAGAYLRTFLGDEQMAADYVGTPSQFLTHYAMQHKTQLPEEKDADLILLQAVKKFLEEYDKLPRFKVGIVNLRNVPLFETLQKRKAFLEKIASKSL